MIYKRKSSICTLLLLTIALIISISNTGKAQDKIRWDDNVNLSWKDFKAKADKSSSMAAETYTRTEFGMAYQEGEFTWKVDCYFSPKNSWVKSELKSEALLSHEQLHFAIAELNARKIRKKMNELELNCMKDSKKLQKTFEDGLKELSATQKLYDKETDHGLNEIPQKEWEQKVMNDLENYKSFSSSKYNFDK